MALETVSNFSAYHIERVLPARPPSSKPPGIPVFFRLILNESNKSVACIEYKNRYIRIDWIILFLLSIRFDSRSRSIFNAVLYRLVPSYRGVGAAMSEGRDAISRDPRINAKLPASSRGGGGGGEGMKTHSPWVSSRLVSDETPTPFFFNSNLAEFGC